ncbi:hypothetical protein KGF56_000112 [Candida oxycetoniae]|uniref:Phosphoribulokinase/uridine kinase domain-containing protein n=1 Tax=Candida oxycetoniae TaxID=497107 RepID=A0AAI9T1Q7_9ASCO|nr:uncharacterized protein KGF56_000112 [Candida oxycetoniae]KAI3407024.2 hypothetical protein KGF56_000112 [Candida oxycetoniae]
MSKASTGDSIIVLLGGGHVSGKKTTAITVKKELMSIMPKNSINVQIIDMNAYTDYSKSSVDSRKFLSIETSAITIRKEDKQYDILKPSRFDFKKLKQDVKLLSKRNEEEEEEPQRVLLVHGLYALYDKELRDLAHIKVFIDGDPDTRLIRWIERDVLERKTDTLEGVINAYLFGARVEMNYYIFPTKEFADVVMPRGAEPNAVRLVIDGVLLYLTGKNAHPERLNVSGYNLRPTEIGIFERERFDVQKNKFYQLN